MTYYEIFFEECSAALGFLVEERGWREVQRRASLASKVVYLKDEIALEIVLDWRDFDISAYVSLWELAQDAWRVDESGRLVREMLDFIADRSWYLSEEVKALRVPAKLVNQASRTRDLELCRLWFRSELRVLGVILRDWEAEIIARARQKLGVIVPPDDPWDRF
jgi:hypothetical protein